MVAGSNPQGFVFFFSFIPCKLIFSSILLLLICIGKWEYWYSFYLFYCYSLNRAHLILLIIYMSLRLHLLGVQVHLTKTISDNVSLVPNLFYRMPMVYFKENYIFSRFQRGSNICPSPLWICACNVWNRLDAVTKVRYEKKLSISNLPGYPYMYTTTIVARPGSKLFFTSELFR